MTVSHSCAPCRGFRPSAHGPAPPEQASHSSLTISEALPSTRGISSPSLVPNSQHILCLWGKPGKRDSSGQLCLDQLSVHPHTRASLKGPHLALQSFQGPSSLLDAHLERSHPEKTPNSTQAWKSRPQLSLDLPQPPWSPALPLALCLLVRLRPRALLYVTSKRCSRTYMPL